MLVEAIYDLLHNNDHRFALCVNTQYQPRKNTYKKSRKESGTRSVFSGFFDILKKINAEKYTVFLKQIKTLSCYISNERS